MSTTYYVALANTDTSSPCLPAVLCTCVLVVVISLNLKILSVPLSIIPVNSQRDRQTYTSVFFFIIGHFVSYTSTTIATTTSTTTNFGLYQMFYTIVNACNCTERRSEYIQCRQLYSTCVFLESYVQRKLQYIIPNIPLYCNVTAALYIHIYLYCIPVMATHYCTLLSNLVTFYMVDDSVYILCSQGFFGNIKSNACNVFIQFFYCPTKIVKEA